MYSTVETIYCTSNLDISEFRETLARFLNGEMKLSFIETQEIIVSVRKNADFDEQRQREFPDGFLFFKFIIEFDFKKMSSIESLKAVSEILNWLWNNKVPAVASVDIPNALPQGGGYNVSDLPWP